MPKMPFQNSAHPTKQLFSHLAFPLNWEISCLSGLRGEVRAKMFIGALWRNMQKVFPLIYVHFCTSKHGNRWFFWVPDIRKLVSLRMCVLWLGFSLCSNAQILTEAFPNVKVFSNTLSDPHPPESKAGAHTATFPLFGTSSLWSSLRSLIWLIL